MAVTCFERFKLWQKTDRMRGLNVPKEFVNIEELAGYDDIASDIISARNSVCAVRSSAHFTRLTDVFQDLRQSLAKAPKK